MTLQTQVLGLLACTAELAAAKETAKGNLASAADLKAKAETFRNRQYEVLEKESHEDQCK